METAFKIGDARYPDNPVYLKNWLNGQPVEARWDGFPWGSMDRRHFAIIRTPDDFWKVRGGTDWKTWNTQAEEFKTYISRTDSQGRYKWEFGFLRYEKRLRMKDWFFDYDDLILQKLITRSEYDLWKDHSKESPIINVDRSFFDLIKNEYESRVLPTELKNQGITSGTYQIGTGAGADYATWTLFAADVNAGGQMTGNLTGEGQNEETLIGNDVEFDTDTNTYLLKLTAESGAEHTGGAYGNGARIACQAGDSIVLNETVDGELADVEISNLAFDITGNNSGWWLQDCGGGGLITVNRTLIAGDTASVEGMYIGGACINARITNNIVYGIGNGAADYGIGFANCGTGDTYYICNNTVVGCYDNFVSDADTQDGTLTFKNNLAQADNGGVDYRDDGGGWGTNAYNISEDATSPNVSYQSKDLYTNSVFKDYANDDFRLDADGDSTNLAIVDDGEDLSGTFTDDIQGQTRSTWYIGASELVAAAGISIPVVQHHRRRH